MINLRAAAALGVGFGARQMAALGLAIADAVTVVVPEFDSWAGGVGTPYAPGERTKAERDRIRRAQNDAVLMVLLS